MILKVVLFSFVFSIPHQRLPVDPHAFVAMIHLAHSINTQNEKILPLMGGEGKDKFSVVVEGNRDLDEVVIEKESTKKV